MRRRSVVTLVLTVTFGGLASLVRGGYTLIDLGQQVLPEAINSHGVVVGITRSGLFTYDAVANSGKLTNIPTPAGVNYEALSINASGAFAGDFSTSSDGPSAYYYANSQFHPLLSTQTTVAHGINDAGHIVGNFENFGFPSTGGWISTDGSTLQPIGAQGESALSINNLDQVTGQGFNSLFYYANGKQANIATPGNASAIGQSISDSGNITGTLQSGPAFLYTNGQFINLPALDAKFVVPTSVNDLGTVVGAASTSVFDQVAFVYQDGVITDLNAFVTPDSGWQLFQAEGVNDAGYIAGYGSVNGLEHGFVLVPTPEPGVALLGVAAVVVLRGRRKNADNSN